MGLQFVFIMLLPKINSFSIRTEGGFSCITSARPEYGVPTLKNQNFFVYEQKQVVGRHDCGDHGPLSFYATPNAVSFAFLCALFRFRMGKKTRSFFRVLTSKNHNGYVPGTWPGVVHIGM